MCLVWVVMSSSMSLPSLTREQKQGPCREDLGIYVVHSLPLFLVLHIRLYDPPGATTLLEVYVMLNRLKQRTTQW